MEGQRLDGWKAIANFLGRDRTTAIRWANDRGLPVHRVPGGGSGSVFARTSELEQWLAGLERTTDGACDDKDATGTQTDTGLQLDTGPANSPTAPKSKPSGWLRGHTLGLMAIAIVLAGSAAIWMRERPVPRSATVGIAPVVSPAANVETVAFADALTADLARFADASGKLVVFERGPEQQNSAERMRYIVHTDIDRGPGGIAADVRLVATDSRAVMWARHFVQTGSVSELRAQLAARLIGVVRCTLDSLEGDSAQATIPQVSDVMAVCDAFDDDDLDRAFARARRLTETAPKLGAAWALRAVMAASLIERGTPLDPQMARESASRAYDLAPDSVLTAIARASTAGPGVSSPEALPVVTVALQHHPDHPWLSSLQSMILFNLGYVQASVQPAVASVRVDPSSLTSRDIAVRRLAAAGHLPEALKLQAENEALWPGHPILKETRLRIVPRLLQPTDVEKAATPPNPYLLAGLSERAGDRRAALRWLAKAPIDRKQMQWSLLFWPDTAGLRTEPAFFEKMERLGLVRWWVARGQWPDFCEEPNLKYSCAEKAAKL